MQKKMNFNSIKNCKKVEIVYVTTYTNNIAYLAWSYTISVALTCTQGKTSKKAHKILISQIALKVQSSA